MAKPEQFFYPLMIVAAVVTVWALFRRQPMVVTSGGGGIQIPSIGPLPAATLVSPGDSPALDFNYISQAASNPLANDPSAPLLDQSVPGYMTYNFNLSAAPQTMPGYPSGSLPAPKSGGCGGSCGGGCSACQGTPCKSGVYTNNGRSTCLSNTPPPDPQIPISGYMISSYYENLYGGYNAEFPN